MLLRVFFLAALLAAPFSDAAFSQESYEEAPQFSITPDAVPQGACYTITVPNWPLAVLSVIYHTAWTGQQTIYHWPSLDWNGLALICTNQSTQVGTYTFQQIRNHLYGAWRPVSDSITVNAGGPPPQPTSLSFSNNAGYAGNDCYVMTVGNGSSMTIDLRYQFNGEWQPTWTMALDGSGRWSYCLNHYDNFGRYDFFSIKNHLSPDWVNLSPSPVTYTVRAPQPKSFTVSPGAIVQGAAYTISVGNGAFTTLDIQYTLNGAPFTLLHWPSLGGSGPPNPDASASVTTSGSTPVGRYVFTAARNAINSAWVTFQNPALLTVCPNAPPAISSVTPVSAARATSVSLTISGSNLCGVSLSTTATGASISDVVWNASLQTVTATLVIGTTTPLGSVPIQLTTPAGNVSTQIVVNPQLLLTKEFIYLNDRLLAVTPQSQSLSATGGAISVNGSQTTHTFTGAGVFRVLSGSGTVEVTALAGGGGGGAGHGVGNWQGGSGGGGGGAGQYVVTSIAVAAGNEFAINIGAGGSGGAPPDSGRAGGASSFGPWVTALGGGGGYGGPGCNHALGGAAGDGGPASGGRGGVICGGAGLSANGGSANGGVPGTGGANDHPYSGGGGGGASASAMGAGGAGGRGGSAYSSPAAPGGPATGYGAGGGGGGADALAGRQGAPGGAGSPGIVIVRYQNTP